MPEIRMPFGELECGFFSHRGSIYFAMPHGKFSFPFPVMDGKISRNSGHVPVIYPTEEVSVIPLQEMAQHGMDIKQGDDPFNGRFWSPA